MIRFPDLSAGSACWGALLVLAGVFSLVPASEPAPAAIPEPEQIEILTRGEIAGIEEIGVGITKPRRVTLVWKGRTMRAAFKDFSEHSTSSTRFRKGPERLTMTFSDDYRYERAAFLLDRELGLGMVPVAVLRKVKGHPGALITWVEGAINEAERQEKHLAPADPTLLMRQRNLMWVFDALIYNVDRNMGNRLYTPDWKLHLIDHSRAFRLRGDLPKAFTSSPASLSRDLYERLEALDAKRLRGLFEGLVSRQQVKYLLERRDRMLEKIRQDIARYGEAAVLGGPGS